MPKVTRMGRRSDVLSSPWDRDWADTVSLDFLSTKESKRYSDIGYTQRGSQTIKVVHVATYRLQGFGRD